MPKEKPIKGIEQEEAKEKRKEENEKKIEQLLLEVDDEEAELTDEQLHNVSGGNCEVVHNVPTGNPVNI